ncbi:hypothetical protein PLCT2_00276 [Planctomycetaceae bacterium]|jgi:hypothetical protein|nr:hypothetical protein PLCT2_00276 [Planctomycetaceae bacterium]
MAASGLVGKAERETFWREQVGAWRVEVERAERAGREPVTVREFCRSRGLREPSFYFWRRELAGRVGTPTARREPAAIFAPVTVRLEPAKALAPFELEIAGFLLRVPQNFDEATLARLLAVLKT